MNTRDIWLIVKGTGCWPRLPAWHNPGVSVCVEGVEDEETFELLRTIECNKMQGFLVSEAVMPDIIRRVYIAVSL